MMNLEAMIDLAVSDARVETGVPMAFMGTGARGTTAMRIASQALCRSPRWSVEEEEYLWENSGTLSIGSMAGALGRSEQAVKIRITRLGIDSARHAPGWISGNQIAKLLGVDSHAPPCWIDKGILRGEHFPYPGRICRRVKIMVFKMWVVQPRSWVYFDALKIVQPYLRRLVLRAQERWGDEWWSTRQAADYHGVMPTDILRQVRMGRITGFRREGGERRREQVWAFWFVRRSEVERLVIPRGSGNNMRRDWSAAGDAFMLRQREEGVAWEVIARRMKQPEKRLQYRYKVLKESRS